jgi:hypothetical protein
MKKFNVLVITSFITISLFAIVLTSCSKLGLTKDKCKDVTCSYSGTCDEGVCTCTAGFEGSNCETKMSTKFIGAFIGGETCTPSSTLNYNIIITEFSANNIKFQNLFGESVSGVYAEVSGTTFTFPLQQLWISGVNYTLSGSGSISGNKLTVNYKLTTVSTSYSCTYIGVK